MNDFFNKFLPSWDRTFEGSLANRAPDHVIKCCIFSSERLQDKFLDVLCDSINASACGSAAREQTCCFDPKHDSIEVLRPSKDYWSDFLFDGCFRREISFCLGKHVQPIASNIDKFDVILFPVDNSIEKEDQPELLFLELNEILAAWKNSKSNARQFLTLSIGEQEGEVYSQSFRAIAMNSDCWEFQGEGKRLEISDTTFGLPLSSNSMVGFLQYLAFGWTE